MIGADEIRALLAHIGWEQGMLAEKLGVTQPTVSRWLKGSVPKPAQQEALRRLMDQVGLHSDAQPDPEVPTTRVPFGGNVGAGGRIDTSTEQGEPGVEYEIALMSIVPDATVAYRVTGESMLPVFEPDMVIVCRAHTTDFLPHLGRRVVVGTRAGERLLKVLVEGSEPERYNLESLNAVTIRNVELAWVAHICAYIPAGEWQILEKNGGSAAFKNSSMHWEDRKEVSRRYNRKKGTT